MDEHTLELDQIKEEIKRYCAFSLGKARIDALTPCFQKLYVETQLKRSSDALSLLYRYGTIPFAGISDITPYVEAAGKDATLGAYELYEIARQGHAVRAAFAYRKAAVDGESVFELIDALIEVLPLSRQIEACINRNYEVMDQASSELARLRRKLSSMQGEIAATAQRYIAKHAASLTDTITAIRGDRICVLAKVSEKNHLSGLVHGESASHQSVYLEPQCLLELNNRLSEIRQQEQEEVNRILYALSQQVKANRDALLANLDTFAHLDELFAKAWWAKEHDGVIASLSETAHLYFKNARHPLIDQKKVVANTYEIKAPHHALLITGSNTGGKTVTLKTIGLFVAMSYCGIAVPCDEAIIPMFDAIYADIGDHQSIAESLSTFSAHIKRLAQICEDATAHSLVLLDELGSGTDPKEGEALAVAILEHLRKRNAMIVATTHYSNVKVYGKNCNDILLASVAFDMDTMQPTYRYMEGVSGTSNAFAIAARYALNEAIIKRAQYFKDAHRSKEEMLLETIEQQQLDLLLEKEKLMKQEQALLHKQEELEAWKQQLEARGKAQEAREQRAFDDLLEDAKAQMDAIIEQAKQVDDSKPHRYHELKRQLAQMESAPEEAHHEDASFALGDYVKLVELGYHGEIISMQKDRVCVLCNGMKLNTTTAKITHMQKPKSAKAKNVHTKGLSKPLPLACNVIGCYVDEALPIIDKYLDNAILAHRNQVRIIHGSGTGALRKGVHAYLKRHPKVSEFRLGQEGEGGLGATVVTLKGKK